MSCHLSRRLTTVHRAVSMALLCSVGYVSLIPSAQAATLGKTIVTSAQHEPLAASITVSNIRAADFSASLANSIIYQQMGLTPTDSIAVRFQPTSATSGQVFITTSKPVSKPFADVVLAINDNGQRNMVPKTLLMPLKDSLPIDTTKNVVTGAKKPNLPSVSPSNARPLTVRKGAPPPLTPISKISTPKLSLPSTSTTELVVSKLPMPSIQAPTVTAAPQNNKLAYAPTRLNEGRISSDARNNITTLDASNSNRQPIIPLNSISLNDQKRTQTLTTNPKIVDARANKNSKGVISADKPPINQPLDTLNIQVTRQIKPSTNTNAENELTATSSAASVPANNTTIVPTDALGASNTPNPAPLNNTISAGQVPSIASDSTSASASADNSAARTTSSQYQVQNNDSLWMIAQQIAQENDLNIQTVMKQIQSQNPDAFINKDADQLKADAKLSLPSYDVLPSQQNLEAAINAQRQYSRRANTPIVKPSARTPSEKTSVIPKPAKRAEKPVTTRTQILPKAQFSVLAPGSDGNADGTQAKAAADAGNGLSTDILATLKASRQGAASQAQRLSKTSSTLNNYTKKLQLQNQKLAELQARLKKLRNQ